MSYAKNQWKDGNPPAIDMTHLRVLEHGVMINDATMEWFVRAVNDQPSGIISGFQVTASSPADSYLHISDGVAVMNGLRFSLSSITPIVVSTNTYGDPYWSMIVLCRVSTTPFIGESGGDDGIVGPLGDPSYPDNALVRDYGYPTIPLAALWRPPGISQARSQDIFPSVVLHHSRLVWIFSPAKAVG